MYDWSQDARRVEILVVTLGSGVRGEAVHVAITGVRDQVI